MHNIRWYFYFI